MSARPAHAVDLHCHIFPDRLPDLAEKYGDPRWMRIVLDSPCAARIMIGDRVFRKITDAAWSPARRLEDMDRAGIAQQVISPTPVTFAYWGDARATLELARYQNEFIAEMVRGGGGRFIGLGTVPLQDPDAAIAEMIRAREELGLAGLELGATLDDGGLHVARLRPFLAAAADLGCPLFLHPWATGERERTAGVGLEFGVGMPAETGFSAAALLASGVMAAHPSLRVCLAHGGGTLAWTIARVAHGRRATDGAELLALTKRFWVDALTYDVANLALLKVRFGADKIVLGTDYPFDAQEDVPGAALGAAAEAGVFTAGETAAIFGPNALRFLGLPQPAALAKGAALA